MWALSSSFSKFWRGWAKMIVCLLLILSKFHFSKEECLWFYWIILIFEPMNSPEYSLNRWLSHKVHHQATILRFSPTIWFEESFITQGTKQNSFQCDPHVHTNVHKSYILCGAHPFFVESSKKVQQNTCCLVAFSMVWCVWRPSGKWVQMCGNRKMREKVMNEF